MGFVCTILKLERLVLRGEMRMNKHLHLVVIHPPLKKKRGLWQTQILLDDEQNACVIHWMGTTY